MLAMLGLLSGAPSALAAPRAAAPASHALTPQVITPDSSSKVAVSPRQGSGGRNGFNGNVEWGTNNNGTYYVEAWGKVWNQTGGTSYVYVYIVAESGSDWNYNIGSASGAGTTKDVDWGAPVEFIDPPATIEVSVCTRTSTSWSCGAPVYAKRGSA
jgi:hypothetical protein